MVSICFFEISQENECSESMFDAQIAKNEVVMTLEQASPPPGWHLLMDSIARSDNFHAVHIHE